MANMVLIRIVRSDNKSFLLGTGTWRILSNGLKGIDFPNFSVYSDKNGVGDGALLSGKRIDDRDVQITCKSVDPSANQPIREATMAFFNPKFTFKLFITYQGVTITTITRITSIKHRTFQIQLTFQCFLHIKWSIALHLHYIALVAEGK